MRDEARALGELVRRFRLRRGLSQEELAQRATLSVRMVSDLERGRTLRPRRRSIELVADALGLSAADRAVLVNAALRWPLSTAASGRAVAVEPPPAAATVDVADDADRLTGGWPVPRQLPPGVASFTGRRTALRELDAVLDRNGPPTVATVVVVSGGAGVGKTALAVEWAHRVGHRFADGQLHVNLRGHAGGVPARTGEVLGVFLDALGVPADRVPVSDDARLGLYRSLLADRRVLVMLDDATDADQVRTLVPASAGCLVVVTSRGEMRELTVSHDAYSLPLGPLDRGEAVELLTRLVGAARITAEPDAVAALTDTCGRLPLALRIAAAALVDRPGLTADQLVAELRDGDQLAALGLHRHATVRVAFDHAYWRLSGAARRMLHLVANAPVANLSTGAAAALAGLSDADTVALLDQLATAHLLDRAGDRIALHDLIGSYARQHGSDLGAEELAAARTRVLAFYLYTLDAGDRRSPHTTLTEPLPAGVRPLELGDDTARDAWLRAEHDTIVEAIARAAADPGLARFAWLLAERMAACFREYRHHGDWIAACRTGLAAAVAAGDPAGQASMYASLGLALQHVGEYAEAVDCYHRAQAVYERIGDPAGTAAVCTDLATAYSATGRLDLADRHLDRARRLVDTAGNPAQRAPILLATSTLRFRGGALAEAADLCLAALHAFRAAGSRFSEINCLSNLGVIQLERGRIAEARTLLGQALRATGDRSYFAPHILANLAAVERDVGNLEEADRLAVRAFGLARDGGASAPISDACYTVATVRHRQGRPEPAMALYRLAASTAHHDQDWYTRTSALTGLAHGHRDLQQPREAREHATEALRLARQHGYRMLESRALTTIALLDLDDSDCPAAIQHANAAVRLAGSTGHRLGWARAQQVLGAALHRHGSHTEAAQAWTEALAMYTSLGTPEADDVRTLLTR